MARALRVGALLALATVAISSWSWAVERELAGVRLGQKALDLLNAPDFGEPNFIGPLAALGEMTSPEQAGGEMQAGGATGRAGPTGPSRTTGGRRRAAGGGQARSDTGPSALAAGPSVQLSLTGGMMGGGGRGRRAGGGGGTRAGAGAGAGGGARRAGAGAGRGTGARAARGAGAGARAAGGGRATGGARVRATTGAAGEGAWMYWYYRRMADVTLVLTLDESGVVRAITLAGSYPYRGGRTSRNIGLSDSYMKIIEQYGYPDRTVTLGTAVQLTYVDHGVRFQLEGMRVRQIAIGAYVTAGVEAAPEQAPESAPPSAGMSIEELRGYL